MRKVLSPDHYVLFHRPQSYQNQKKPVIVKVRKVQRCTTNHRNPQKGILGEYITTIEGNSLFVDDSNYIIMGTHGEIYPCRKDIFHETYELIIPTKPLTKESK